MKRIILSSRFYIPVLGLLFLFPLLYDMFTFYSKVKVLLISFISELFTLLFAILYYIILKNKFNCGKKPVKENLHTFIKLMGLFYLSLIVAKIIFNPVFAKGVPQTISTILYSNIAAISGVLFLTPMLLIVVSLIFYKRTKTTYNFMRLCLILAGLSIVSAALLQSPLNFSFEGAGIFINILLIITLIPIFLLSLRNTWITFLSRAEKYTYFLIGLLLVWATLYLLFGFTLPEALSIYGYGVGAYLILIWFILIGYIGFAALYLLLQLPTSRAFDRKMREVNSLYNLGRTINSEIEFNRLVKVITDMTSEVIGSESNWLELIKENSTRLYIASSHNLTKNELENDDEVKQKIIQEEIIETKSPVIINELSKMSIYLPLKKWKPAIESLIGVPLISGTGHAMGVLFASKSRPFGFDLDDLTMLEAYANQAVIALENAYLLNKSLERERLEQELKIAREAQQRLLPKRMPSLEHIDMEALSVTAYEVGGDYYDFIELAGDRLGIFIGDVSGKGTSAAFYMAQCKGCIQSLCKIYDDPEQLLIKANEIIYGSFDRKSFITLLMASISTKEKKLTFARAGHCPMIYYQAKNGAVEVLKPSGIGVGLECGEIFAKEIKKRTISFHRGDLFIFYTDGLSEARNSDGLDFGEERLCQLVKNNADKPVKTIKEILIETVLAFSEGENLEDDLTLIIVKT